MSISVRRALVATGTTGAVVVGLAAAALIGGPAAGAATGRGPVTYRISSGGHIKGPGHLAPGHVAIKLRGFASQEIDFVKPFHKTYTRGMLLKDAAAAIGQGKPDALEGNFAFAGGGSPHSTIYLSLEAGTYYLLDPNAAHLTVKNIRVLHVNGKHRNAHIPRGPRLAAKGMHTWGSAPKSLPQRGVLHFSNKSSDWHFLEIDKLRKGKTFADVKKVLANKEPYGAVFASKGKYIHFTMALVSPGRGEAGSYHLSKGNYAILCFFPDHKTGIPHAFEGMARGIRVR